MMQKALFAIALALPMVLMAIPGTSIGAAQPPEDPVTIHLTEYNGYFAADEVLMNLDAGDYVFVVKNEAGKLVGFQAQHLETHKQLAAGALKPGETKEFKVKVSEEGIRFRCPINPTPWYEYTPN